jgi:hypothetical protein
MPDPDELIAACEAIEAVAGAIRRELGAEVEAYPGHRCPEAAEPLNRAFRAVARALLAAAVPPAADLPARLSRALRLVAERRLAGEGLDGRDVRALLEQEPGSPDDWLTFLLLAAPTQLEPLLGPAQSDDA